MVNPISVTGTFVKATGSSLVTLTVVPSKVGNALFFTASYIASATLSTVSGGGSTWTKLVGAFTAYSGSAKIDLWMGVISTTGSSTITIAGSGLTNTQRLCSQEFTSGGGKGTIWAQDGAGGTKTNSSNATVTFPTLTPSGVNRMYIGYGLNANSATSVSSGYTLDLDSGSNPYIFNSNVSTVQTPTSTQTAALSGTIGALVTATNPTEQLLPFFM